MEIGVVGMEKKEILITVKTAPTASRSYFETVCTAGVTREGELIRIYPVPFRLLENGKRYRKYDWISVDVEPRDARSDMRKESFRCDARSIRVLGRVSAADNWRERKRLCIDSQKVYARISDLLQASKPSIPGFISLAVFKPKLIRRVIVEKREVIEDMQRQEEIKQLFGVDMFDGEDYRAFQQAKPMDAVFKYEFIDENDSKHAYMIEDWELYELYRRFSYDRKVAISKVKQKYESLITDCDVFFSLERDCGTIAKVDRILGRSSVCSIRRSRVS